ncbi:hypothetical protein RYX36_031564, partial [Vicia faba]
MASSFITQTVSFKIKGFQTLKERPLLLALYGKLDPSLQLAGSVTYNGHGLNEFVPPRTAAYISQHDVHIGEMTVRETLDFSVRCQGVGSRYDMLFELFRREKSAQNTSTKSTSAYMFMKKQNFQLTEIQKTKEGSREKENSVTKARCQGVGSRYDMLSELSRREKSAHNTSTKATSAYMFL